MLPVCFPQRRQGAKKSSTYRQLCALSCLCDLLCVFAPLREPLSFYFSFFFTSAGTPATSESGGTSFVTTDPAPVIDLAPTLTGATSIVSEPILTSSSMIVSCLCLPS